MSYDDHIPDHDEIANRARHALHQIAGARPLDASWADVQKSARRVQQRRLSVVGAACAIVLLGAGVAVAAAGSDGSADNGVRGETPATSTSTTTTSVPFVFGSSSAPPTPPDGNPINTAPPANPTIPTPDTGPAVLQPQDGLWELSVSTDSAQVTVGDTFIIHAELRNTGTQAQETIGYRSWAVSCDWPVDEPRPEGLPVGQFVDYAVLQPGETHTASLSFVAEPQFVGTIVCGIGLTFHGNPNLPARYGYPPHTVTIEIVAPPDTTTSTTTPETTTTLSP